jgi:stage IV sporulation protein B
MLDRYRVGLYVRDRASGVGTLTFVDRITGRFGALGHLVTDNDTGQALTVKSGQIVAATVASVEASQKGAPGSKRSVVVAHERVLGAIEKNTQFGIFGDWSGDMPQDAEMSIALHRQVYPGHAQMLTVIKGEKVEAFDIEIERVNEQNLPAQKGLVIKVTDERLLREVGGIVQGMSGSPIVQDGRLVGAVTHVFVNDPTRGYGILAEWMVQESGLLERRQQTAPTFFYRQFGRGI